MPGRPDLLRAAGNVFLAPVDLAEMPAASTWRAALLVGSRDPDVIRQTREALREFAPALSALVLGGESLLAVRRRRYDAVCLLQTGERRRREKLIGLLSGARTAIARSRQGRWYLVWRPRFEPLSLVWWARCSLACLLSLVCLLVVLAVRASDLLWRIAPLPPPIRDPGPPQGRRTTFIVPTHDQKGLMDFCLPPLLAEAGGHHQVMVVDDASTDGTAEYVRGRYPSVRLLRLPRNCGFAGAVRAGVAACATPLFALINTDVAVRPGFLAAILLHFDKDDTFAVCSRIELPGGSRIETGNVAPAFSGILEPHHLPPGPPGPILFAGGASSVFHRARYHALAGMETIFTPLYWEDIELGYRAWRVGWRSIFEPGASVRHERRAWIGQRFGDVLANQAFLKNALIFVWKNVRDCGMLWEHLAYVCARLHRELPEGDGMMCGALLRALPTLPQALVRRWRERRRGDLEDRDILAMASPPSQTPREGPVR